MDLDKKWSNMQIIALINAYKKETCLYARHTPYHRNKRAPKEALRRVGNAVRILRPNASDQDCLYKFSMLRAQYNMKSTKVKSSIKSGTESVSITYSKTIWNVTSQSAYRREIRVHVFGLSFIHDKMQAADSILLPKNVNFELATRRKILWTNARNTDHSCLWRVAVTYPISYVSNR